MKRILLILLLLTFLGACASSTSFQALIDEDARVSSFLTTFPDATYAQAAYAGDELAAMRDLVEQECGKIALPSKLVRATYSVPAATLAAYVDPDQAEILCVASKLNQDAFAVEQGDPSSVAEGTLMTVNGEPITQADIQAVLVTLPEEARTQANAGAILNQLVNDALLRQAAAEYEVSDQEVEEAIERSWQAAGFESEEAFLASLEGQGTTYEVLFENVRDQLRLQKLLAAEGVTNVSVSEEAARDYYLRNTNAFLVSEQVRFRQLFIGYNQSGSREAALARLQNVLEQINGGQLDFCTAVNRYSDDTASRERCGEYAAPRGVLSPQIEASLFALGVNESTVTESEAGFHLFVLLAKQPTSVLPYEEAAGQVLGALRNQAVQQRLSLYLLTLRADAELIEYT